MDRISMSEEVLRPQLLTLREFRPFKTSDEYLWAMKEDLSDWLNLLYPELSISPQKFMECLETGITLCQHANNVRSACKDWMSLGRKLPKCWGRDWKLPSGEVVYNRNAKPETFFARDNVHNFITWCRKLGIFECLLFESDDLILRKNEKNVILCLLEVARRGSHFGMATPLLVQFEKEIDRDIAKDTGQELSSSGEEEESYLEYGPTPQIITNDLRSLDEMVRELVERCSCPTQFPMIRVAEGKYRIGNTKVMIYVRILRNHVMVRVGGGWDTLAHYLDKHDPCRCSSGHRVTVSSRLVMRNDGSAPRMKVEYERRDLPFEPIAHSTPNYNINNIRRKKSSTALDLSDSSSEISDEGYKTSDNIKMLLSGGGIPGKVENPVRSTEHQSRKLSIARARSLSTDEERPDSRSTDEEISHCPQPKERNIMKSVSMGRVPRTTLGVAPNGGNNNLRSTSCERPRQRFVSGETSGFKSRFGVNSNGNSESKPRWNTCSKPVGNVNLLSKPTRSLSASGTTEFYRRTSLTPRNIKNKPAPLNNTGVCNNVNSKSNGKNTWNGPSPLSSGTSDHRALKTRPNLFNANFFKSGTRQPLEPQRTKSNDSEFSNEPSVEPNLAEWIRRALELESDSEKISHIELAIRQFEQQHQAREDSPEFSSYNSSSENPESIPYIEDSCNSFSLPIRKRKENGLTKIPRPNFY